MVPASFSTARPSAACSLLPHEGQFAALGLRAVSPDRPGYGRSSPPPGRSLADWPADVAHSPIDSIGRFIVAAHSSAVVCAALLPERVMGGIVVAGVTDMSWPPAWDGYLESEIQLMRLPDENAALAWRVNRWGADGSGFLAEPFDLTEPFTEGFRQRRNGIRTGHLRPGPPVALRPGPHLRTHPLRAWGTGHHPILAELPAIASALVRARGY